jgi:nitrate/TMAO reductase-like tetraheme cytochrome c subunit
VRGRYARAIAVVVLAGVAIAPSAFAVPSIPSSTFTSEQFCSQCHRARAGEWAGSMHAQALEDPVYRAKLAEGERATGGAIGAFCTPCHAPVASMGGEVSGLDVSRVSPVGAEAITCDFCHQVTGTNLPAGNASWQMQPVPDGTKRAQYGDAKSPVHATAYSRFHQQAEFCAMCHNVSHPLNGVDIEATYTEWKNGPYAKDGVVCQDCHMTPRPGRRARMSSR